MIIVIRKSYLRSIVDSYFISNNLFVFKVENRKYAYRVSNYFLKNKTGNRLINNQYLITSIDNIRERLVDEVFNENISGLVEEYNQFIVRHLDEIIFSFYISLLDKENVNILIPDIYTFFLNLSIMDKLSKMNLLMYSYDTYKLRFRVQPDIERMSAKLKEKIRPVYIPLLEYRIEDGVLLSRYMYNELSFVKKRLELYTLPFYKKVRVRLQLYPDFVKTRLEELENISKYIVTKQRRTESVK